MYRLTRKGDNKVIEGEKIGFIEWDESGRFSKIYTEPGIGRSVILDPHYFKYTWMTTDIVEFNYENAVLHFVTRNSDYILETL
jgi:hypothetical protein